MLWGWEVDFEAINLEGASAAQAELEALGVLRPPALVLGEQVVHGWQPAAYARLVGVAWEGAALLEPEVLRRRLDQVLALTQTALAGLPPSALQLRHPARERSVHDLAFHVFRLSAAYLDCLEQGRFCPEWFAETAPAEVDDAAALITSGEQVRTRLARWFATAPAAVYAQTAQTFYGECSVHELLERTTWHAAQHMRQIYDLLATHHSLRAPLPPAAVYAGLPIPEAIW